MLAKNVDLFFWKWQLIFVKFFKDGEKPYKVVKARPKLNVPKEQRTPLSLNVYGYWQTEPYFPGSVVDVFFGYFFIISICIVFRVKYLGMSLEIYTLTKVDYCLKILTINLQNHKLTLVLLINGKIF